MSKELSAAVRRVVQGLAGERGWSARQLADASGMNERAVQRKLGGQSAFDIDDLRALGPAFGVSAAELLAWAESS